MSAADQSGGTAPAAPSVSAAPAVATNSEVVAKRPKEPKFATKKAVVANREKVVANPEVGSSGKSNLPLIEELIEELDLGELDLGEEIDEVPSGWRLEENSNGYLRWRWQVKDDNGDPVTYVNKSGKTGYRRGSKYVGKRS